MLCKPDREGSGPTPSLCKWITKSKVVFLDSASILSQETVSIPRASVSIPRAVLHCKGVLHLLETAGSPQERCVCKPAAGWPPKCSVSDSSRVQRSAVVISVLCWCVPPTCMEASVFTLRPSCLPFPRPALDPQTTQALLHTSSVPCDRTNAPSLGGRSPSCCAVTYLYSHQSQLHCRRRTPPHPARCHLHRYPHPRSGSPQGTKGWAGQANTQWLLNQTSSSLDSKQRIRALGDRSHKQVFMSCYLLVREFIQSLIQSPVDMRRILLLISAGLILAPWSNKEICELGLQGFSSATLYPGEFCLILY